MIDYTTCMNKDYGGDDDRSGLSYDPQYGIIMLLPTVDLIPIVSRTFFFSSCRILYRLLVSCLS